MLQLILDLWPLVDCRMIQKEFEAIWVSADDIAAEGLLLSKHMFLDHLPDRTIVVLTRALRRVEVACEEEQTATMPGNTALLRPSSTLCPALNQRAVSASGLQLPEIEVESGAGGARESVPDALGRATSASDLRSRRSAAPNT